MTTRDEDILDFDFFGEEEPPSWEDPPERGPGPPRDRGPRGRGPRSPGNLTPLLRLVGLIALAILIVVLLAVWVEGCSSDRKTERYRDYSTDARDDTSGGAGCTFDSSTSASTAATR